MTQRPWRQHVGTSAASRGYDADWERLRQQVLSEETNCRACGSPATDVDHAIPKALGGTDLRANLEALCGPCHRTKTARESHGVIISIARPGQTPRLFVDIDGTLVRFGGGVNPGVQLFVRMWAREHPAGRVTVWSIRGAAYAQRMGIRHLLDVTHDVADKAALRPQPGWLFIDDDPLPSWAACCVRPGYLHPRERRRREPERHPGEVC